MTMVVAYKTRRYVVMVSDRLVSLQSKIATKDYDLLSNKNVIFRTPDSICAIGYTGNAYMEGRPTDQWIVENIIGRKFDQYVDFIQGFHGYKIPKLQNVLWRLESNFRSLPNFVGAKLLTTGIRINRRSLELPFLHTIPWNGGTTSRMRYEEYGVMTWVGQPPTPESIADFRGELPLANSAEDSPSAVVKAISRLIRSTADVKVGVGKDLMHIVMDLNDWPIWSEFSPNDTESAIYSYSPWLVGLRGLHAPTITSTNMLEAIKGDRHGLDVRIRGPKSTSNGTFFAVPSPRMADPLTGRKQFSMSDFDAALSRIRNSGQFRGQ